MQALVSTERVGSVMIEVFYDDESHPGGGYVCCAYTTGGGDYLCTGGLVPLVCESDCEAAAAARHLGEALRVLWNA